MEIEIDSKKKNPLLDREDIYFIIHHEDEGTPERELVRQKLAEKLNTKKDAVIIDHIKAASGFQQSKGYAKAYGSADKAQAIERSYLLKRNPAGGAPAKKKETEETEEKEEAASAESEKKEEAEEAEEKEKPKEQSEKAEEKEAKKTEKKEEKAEQAAEPKKEESKQKESEKKEKDDNKKDEKKKEE